MKTYLTKAEDGARKCVKAFPQRKGLGFFKVLQKENFC